MMSAPRAPVRFARAQWRPDQHRPLPRLRQNFAPHSLPEIDPDHEVKSPHANHSITPGGTTCLRGNQGRSALTPLRDSLLTSSIDSCTCARRSRGPQDHFAPRALKFRQLLEIALEKLTCGDGTITKTYAISPRTRRDSRDGFNGSSLG